MPHQDTICHNGVIARKGTKGFLPAPNPKRRLNLLRVRLSDQEMTTLRTISKARQLSPPQLIREIIAALHQNIQGSPD